MRRDGKAEPRERTRRCAMNDPPLRPAIQQLLPLRLALLLQLALRLLEELAQRVVLRLERLVHPWSVRLARCVLFQVWRRVLAFPLFCRKKGGEMWPDGQRGSGRRGNETNAPVACSSVSYAPCCTRVTVPCSEWTAPTKAFDSSNCRHRRLMRTCRRRVNARDGGAPSWSERQLAVL